jgi:hypothetical protein
MLTEVVKKLSFKYTVWLLVALLCITIGYWTGRLHVLKVDVSVLELSLASLAEALRACWVMPFHLVLTFLALRDIAAKNALQQKWAALGVDSDDVDSCTREVNAGRMVFVPPPHDDDERQKHFEHLLVDLDGAVPPLVTPRVHVQAGVPTKALMQASSLVRKLTPVLTNDVIQKLSDLSSQTEAAAKAHDTALTGTKVQRTLNVVVTLAFLGVVVYLVYTSAWLLLAPVAAGITLGWLLAASEDMSGLQDRFYYPYLVAIALVVGGIFFGVRAALDFKPPVATLELTTGQDVEGNLLFRGNDSLVLKDDDGDTTYIDAAHVAVLRVSPK